MKNFILTAAAAFACLVSPAQVSNLTFQSHQGLFTELSNYPTAMIITHLLYDDDVTPSQVTLPFTFSFAGAQHDTLHISENGFVWFGQQEPFMQQEYYPISTPHSPQIKGIISPLGTDLEPHKHSGLVTSLQSGVVGVAPNRMFIVQWLNTSRFNLSMTGDTLSFQIKFYEGSNEIEFAYGYFGINANQQTGAEVGLKGDQHSDFNNRTVVTGNWANSSPGASQNEVCQLDSVSKPSFGRLFRWTGLSTGLSERESRHSFKVFPNPFSDKIGILSSSEIELSYRVSDMSGRVIKHGIIVTNTVDLSELKAGTYFLYLEAEGIQHRELIIKTEN
jgi:hypothetical protein